MIFTNVMNLCKKQGISIAKLEKETGLGNATIRRWGNSSPNVDNLKRVADYLGVSIEMLLVEQEGTEKNERRGNEACVADSREGDGDLLRE